MENEMDSKLPPGYNARPATLDDAAGIAAVVNAETLETYGYPKTSAAVERSDLQSPALDLARDTLVVVGPDGRIVRSATFIYHCHFPVTTMTANKDEQKLYAELRQMRAAIEALQARIDYVLLDLREYRWQLSRGPEDTTRP